MLESEERKRHLAFSREPPSFFVRGIVTLRFEDGKIIEDSLFHPRHGQMIKGGIAEHWIISDEEPIRERLPDIKTPR